MVELVERNVAELQELDHRGLLIHIPEMRATEPGSTVFNIQSAQRRLAQPSRQADIPSLGGLASSFDDRLLQCDGHPLTAHRAILTMQTKGFKR
jgi:hypothetical protein